MLFVINMLFFFLAGILSRELPLFHNSAGGDQGHLWSVVTATAAVNFVFATIS